MCTSAWTHWCTDPLLAVMLNPIHGNYDLETAHLWEGEGTVGATDHGLKIGCADGVTIRRVRLPRVTGAQRVRFGILCALTVCRSEKFKAWAKKAWPLKRSGVARAKSVAEAEAMRAGATTTEAWAVLAVVRAEEGAVRTAAQAAAEAAAAAAKQAARRAVPINLAALAKRAVEEGRA